MRALVIGYGSVGERHARVLGELGCRVAVLSRRSEPTAGAGVRWFSQLDDALAAFKPDYCVVANETASHASTLDALSIGGFRGAVLVEKPLFAAPQRRRYDTFARLLVGYNLRFHPLVAKLAEFARATRVMAAVVYVGQYLPEWRRAPRREPSYSQTKAGGGGVLRDLSHEIDYLRWIFGGVQQLAAVGGRFGEVTIDSDDVFALLMRTARCPAVSLQMNYLDRNARREVTFLGADDTMSVDLVNGSSVRNGKTTRIEVPRDSTYRDMHRAALGQTTGPLAEYGDGIAVVDIVDAAERANAQRAWVSP